MCSRVLRAHRNYFFLQFLSTSYLSRTMEQLQGTKIQTSKHMHVTACKLVQNCPVCCSKIAKDVPIDLFTHIALKAMVCNRQMLTQHRDMDVVIPAEFVFA